MILDRFRKDKDLGYYNNNDVIVRSFYSWVDQETRPEGIVDALIETLKIFAKRNEECQNKLLQYVMEEGRFVECPKNQNQS